MSREEISHQKRGILDLHFEERVVVGDCEKMDSLEKERNDNSKEIGDFFFFLSCRGQRDAVREYHRDKSICRRSYRLQHRPDPGLPHKPPRTPELYGKCNRKPLRNIE